MSTQKLFVASIILFLLSVFILATTPSAQAANCSCAVKSAASNAIALA